MGRVGGGEQPGVDRGESRAPPREAGVDLGFAESRGLQRPARVRRRGVAGNVGPFHGPPVDLLERAAVRLDVDLVVRQQQRAVDVEEDEPVSDQAAITASRASRSKRT